MKVTFDSATVHSYSAINQQRGIPEYHTKVSRHARRTISASGETKRVSFVRVLVVLVLFAASAVPAATAADLFNNTNVQAVLTGYNAPWGTPFNLNQAANITQLVTYHWNDGRGNPNVGIITIWTTSRQLLLTAQAHGEAGQGGVIANWVADLANPFFLPAGSYILDDSSHDTWSHNSGTAGCLSFAPSFQCGFAIIRGNVVAQQGTSGGSASATCPDPFGNRYATLNRLNVAAHLQVRNFRQPELCEVLDALEFIAEDTDGTYSVDDAGKTYTPLLFAEGGIKRISFNLGLSAPLAGWNDYIGVYVSGLALNVFSTFGCQLFHLCDPNEDVELGPGAFPKVYSGDDGDKALIAAYILHEASHTALGPHSDGANDKDMNHSYGTQINYLLHLLQTRKIPPPPAKSGSKVADEIRSHIQSHISDPMAQQQFTTLLTNAVMGIHTPSLHNVNWNSFQVNGLGVPANQLPAGTCVSTHFCWDSFFDCPPGNAASVHNLVASGNFIGTPVPHITGSHVEVIAPKTQDAPLFGGAVAKMSYQVQCQ